MKTQRKFWKSGIKMVLVFLWLNVKRLLSTLESGIELLSIGIEEVADALVNKDKSNGALMNANKILSHFNSGIRFGDRATQMKDVFSHTLVFGPSGSGKSATVFYNNLLTDPKASLIVRDVPRDFAKNCSGWFNSIGYKVRIINPTDALLSTDAINVLAGEMNKGDIARVAQMIVSASYKERDYWTQSAEEYGAVFLTILKQCCPKEQHNIFNLKFLIENFIADVRYLDQIVSQHADEELMTSFMALVATPEKTRQSSLSTLKSSLARIDENIALVTSQSTFDWKELRKEKTVVFIQSDVLDDEYLSLVQNLLYTQILRSFMQELPKEDDLPIKIFLDECSSLSIGKILETSFLNLRKYRIGLCAAFQSPQSIESSYDKDISAVIQANSFAKLYLPGMDLQTAKYLEEYIGYHEVKKKDGRTIKEAIMSAFAIRTLKGKAVLLTGNNPVSVIRLKPFFKISRMKKRHGMPIPKLMYLKEKLNTDFKISTVKLKPSNQKDNEKK